MPHVRFPGAVYRPLAAVVILASAELTACRDTPMAFEATPAPMARALVQAPEQHILTTTSSYANSPESNRIAFATSDGAAAWDDIKITQGTTVITESFAGDVWNTNNFELYDPVNYPGSASGGAYRSSGSTRGVLRTKAEFKPTALAPLRIEATLTPDTDREVLSFLAWRSTGTNIAPYNEPSRSLYLRLHNYVNGLTYIGNTDVETQLGDAFYREGKVRVVVVDNGSDITVTLTRIGNAPPVTTTGFRSPVSMTGLNTVTAGAAVPLKFQLTRDEAIVSDRAEIQSLVMTPVVCGAPQNSDRVLGAGTGPVPTTIKYDPIDQQFVHVWRTPQEPGCYAVTLTLTSGETQTADFMLRR